MAKKNLISLEFFFLIILNILQVEFRSSIQMLQQIALFDFYLI